MANWDNFARRHGGQPFLSCETLYSLSEAIIGAIQTTVPGFFTEEQERFERDLASNARFGFFNRSALSDPSADHSFEDTRQARSAEAIKAMLAEEYRRGGAAEAEIRDSFEAETERREVIDVRKEAYTGWLVTNSEFRKEARNLRAKWKEQIGRLGRFPRIPQWPLHDFVLGADVPDKLIADFLGFYCRWNLEQMLTWEWPIPMEPNLFGGKINDDVFGADAGVKILVPWYLLRGEKLNLQEIIRHNRATDSPRHLREWVQKTRRKQDELGDRRYERLAWLYRYLELALRQRYPEACRRRAQKLDRAFSSVLNRDEESVKKLRLELQRALRPRVSASSATEVVKRR